MNSTFNFTRFGLLARQYFTLGWLHLAISAVVIFGISKILLVFVTHMAWMQGGITAENIEQVFRGNQNSIFKSMLVISGTIFASTSFNDFGNRGEGIAFLMTPATHLEKFLFRFLMSTVYFLVVGTALFLLADWLNIAIFNSIRPVKIPPSVIGSLFSGEVIRGTLEQFFFFQAMFLLGSIWLQKGHWWTTAAVGMGLIGLFALTQYLLQNQIWLKDISPQQLDNQWFVDIPHDGFYKLPVAAFWEKTWSVLKITFPPLCWFLTYLKLTEKEI